VWLGIHRNISHGFIVTDLMEIEQLHPGSTCLVSLNPKGTGLIFSM